MLRRFSINFALFSMLLDGIVVASSLWFSAAVRPLLNRFDFIEPMPSHVVVPSFLYLIFPLLWVLVYASLAIYDGKKYIKVVDEFSALSLGIFIAAISSAGILYLSYREVSRALFLVFVVLAYLAALSWRALARWGFRSQKPSPENGRRIVIVGAGPLGQQVYTQIELAPGEQYSLVGFIDDNTEIQSSHPILGNAAMVCEIVERYGITDVVIALPHSAYHKLADIVQCLDDRAVQLWVALGFFDLALYKTGIEDFGGIPMLDLRASAIDGSQRLVKRAFDIFSGTLGLIVAMPLITVVAVVILLDDGPPVLFRQKRVGENGRLFEILKFRTMVRGADKMQEATAQKDDEGHLVHKTRKDARITRVGRFLRRLSLDELPQLINVVRGDMSLVGPRPEMPYLVQQYQPWQRKRFAVPPGLTGWWQINGRSDRPMHLHTEDDLYYIQNYSIWLDIQIILRTVWAVLLGRGAF